MVKRKDDKSSPPAGGRAAQRLRQFEDARRPQKQEQLPEEAEQVESDQRDEEPRSAADEKRGNASPQGTDES